MSGVLIRCPTCGTTQNELGECDACYEGDAGYFCTNHSPGLWLDSPVCEGCGAKFGDAPRRPDPRPPIPRRVERPRLERPAPSAAEPEDIPATPSLADLLAHISEARARARYEVDDVPVPERLLEVSRKSLPVVGCVVRLVLFALLLIGLALGGLFILMAGGMWGVLG